MVTVHNCCNCFVFLCLSLFLLLVILLNLSSFQSVSTSLAEHDVVITTYSLVSKEIPVQKEDAEKPSKDSDHVVNDSFNSGDV